MKKAFYKRTADAFEKLGIAGFALAIFQGNNLWWPSIISLALSYFFTFLGERK